MKFQFNDGGRSEAGYKGHAGDCVARAIAIATGRPYAEIYEILAQGNFEQRKTKKSPKTAGKKTASHGISVKRKWFKDYMKSLGFTWVPCMKIGTGCKVHLTDGELPNGRLVVSVSGHYTCVIDQVINDTFNPERNIDWLMGDGSQYVQKRCVYGYYILN